MEKNPKRAACASLVEREEKGFEVVLIRDLHTGTTARVRTSQGMSDVFYTTSGVRQARLYTCSCALLLCN